MADIGYSKVATVSGYGKWLWYMATVSGYGKWLRLMTTVNVATVNGWYFAQIKFSGRNRAKLWHSFATLIEMCSCIFVRQPQKKWLYRMYLPISVILYRGSFLFFGTKWLFTNDIDWVGHMDYRFSYPIQYENWLLSLSQLQWTEVHIYGGIRALITVGSSRIL
jgi:hypothetical protein